MRFILLLLAFWIQTSLPAQEKSRISLFEKLYGFDSIRLTITYPFDSLKKSNNNEVEALITIETDRELLVTNQPLTLNIRGKYRRMKCTFPPILLNFKKSMLKSLGLTSGDEMKLVTHCIEGEEGQLNLQEERMLYQVYESITPNSYRTIWVTVHYCDSQAPAICDTSTGFLLEPDADITSRLGIFEKKVYNPKEDSLDFETYGRTVAFNFLIGNRDWSIAGARNAKLFYDTSAGKYIVIPYDFDFSNVVGASYRRETLPRTMVHPFDRIYQGEYFNDKAGLILKSFYAFHDTIINTIKIARNPLFEERRMQISKYFEKWFTMIKKNRPGDLMYDCVCRYNGGL
ncbi:MAG TPA: hypothetical protein VFG10_07670 [Saprospiraceae bacterium]|nr:hypothetical protein [Saprospiraceae bacterium]